MNMKRPSALSKYHKKTMTNQRRKRNVSNKANPVISQSKSKQRRPRKGRWQDKYPRARKIRLVALSLFSHQGYAAVTMKAIADQAGVNTSLIYYYFRNKRDLYEHAIEGACHDALASSRKLIDACADPVEVIENWFNNHIILADEIRHLITVLLDYSKTGVRSDYIESQIRYLYREEADNVLSKAVQEGIDLNIFSYINPQILARFVSVHLDGLLVASVIRKDFDYISALNDLRSVIWLLLEYKSKDCTIKSIRRR